MASRFIHISFPSHSGRTLCHVHILPADKPVFVNIGNEELFFIRIDAATRSITGKSPDPVYSHQVFKSIKDTGVVEIRQYPIPFFSPRHEEMSTDTYIEDNSNRPCNQVDQHLATNKGGRQMVRHYRRSIYDELDDLRASMDYLFQLVLEPVDEPLLPKGESPAPVNLYPDIPAAEVFELEDEVIVTIKLIPGPHNRVFSCVMLNEKTLKISCELQEFRNIEHEGYSMTEQREHATFALMLRIRLFA